MYVIFTIIVIFIKIYNYLFIINIFFLFSFFFIESGSDFSKEMIETFFMRITCKLAFNPGRIKHCRQVNWVLLILRRMFSVAVLCHGVHAINVYNIDNIIANMAFPFHLQIKDTYKGYRTKREQVKKFRKFNEYIIH